jgi:hypothetical protein
MINTVGELIRALEALPEEALISLVTPRTAYYVSGVGVGQDGTIAWIDGVKP